MGKKAQKAAKRKEYFELFRILLSIVYFILIFIIGNIITNPKSNPDIIDQKTNFNFFLSFFAWIFLMIDIEILYSSITNIKRIKTEQSKTATVQRNKAQKPAKNSKQFKMFCIVYFTLSTVLIFFSTLNCMFTRQVLTKNSIQTYNCFNVITHEYRLDDFYNLSLSAYSERSKHHRHGKISLHASGEKSFSFPINYSKLSNLEFLRKIKDTYGLTLNKDYISDFKQYSDFQTWPEENKKVFNEIFNEN